MENAVKLIKNIKIDESDPISSSLDLDTLRLFQESDDSRQSTPTNIDPTYKGVYVSHVNPLGQAYLKGVRVGDYLLKTSATVGDGMWDKFNVQGVRAALQSRLAVSKTVGVVFGRSGDRARDSTVIESFELTLKRPIGMQLTQVDDGNGRAVVVKEVMEDNFNRLRDSVAPGDRVVEVEAALGGKMWPHTTVDGVVAAVNGRLPGQGVRIRFERTVEVGGFEAGEKGFLGGAERGETEEVSGRS